MFSFTVYLPQIYFYLTFRRIVRTVWKLIDLHFVLGTNSAASFNTLGLLLCNRVEIQRNIMQFCQVLEILVVLTYFSDTTGFVVKRLFKERSENFLVLWIRSRVFTQVGRISRLQQLTGNRCDKIAKFSRKILKVNDFKRKGKETISSGSSKGEKCHINREWTQHFQPAG